MQLFSLAGIVLAWIVAVRGHSFLLPWLSKIGLQGDWATGIAFVVSFLLVLILAVAIGKLLTVVFDFTPLGILNRLAGILLGLLQGVFVLGLLLLLLEKLQHQYQWLNEQDLLQSVAYTTLHDTLHFLDLIKI